MNYETHLHVIEEDEFPGWTFPHYDIGGESVDEWWNSDKLIKGNNKMPIAGMYRVTFRSWNVGDTKSILAGIIDSAKGSEPNVATLTNIFLIKTFNRAATADSNPPVVVPQDMFHPFASFNNKITVTSDDYLLLSGMLGLAARWGDISAWEDHPDPNPYDYENCYEGGTVDQETVDDFFKGNITGINGEWADIAVPLINHTSLSLWWFFNRVKFVDCFKIQVKFKDLYWSAITEDWSPSPNTFSLPLETQGELEKIIGQIKTHYPPVHTPLYEELGQGYAIRFGERQDGTGTANTGTGTLSIKLFFGFTDIPLTIWL